jgi:hypothetical protein
MRTYTNIYAQKIYAIISPLVGDIMAAGILKSQVLRLNISEEQITVKHIPQLAESIRQGLVLFTGSGIAEQVAKKIAEIK